MNNRNELIIVIATTALLAFTVFTVLNTGTGCGRGGNGLSEKAIQADCVSHLALICRYVWIFSMSLIQYHIVKARRNIYSRFLMFIVNICGR